MPFDSRSNRVTPNASSKSASRLLTADAADREVCAAMAKAWVGEAAVHVTADTIQIHGGVGFTWEYDAHLYFKRAKSSESLLGDAPQHRERVARHLGL